MRIICVADGVMKVADTGSLYNGVIQVALSCHPSALFLSSQCSDTGIQYFHKNVIF
ncbi:MAG: hypothetical protein ACR5K9_06740 [Wolbachia sp.]